MFARIRGCSNRIAHCRWGRIGVDGVVVLVVDGVVVLVVGDDVLGEGNGIETLAFFRGIH